jgi:hypothetical protein
MKSLNKNSTATVLAACLLFGLIGPVAALAAGPAPVNLGTAGNFVILAKTGISTTGPTSIVGDLGLSPAAASYITGFGLTLSAGGPFSTSALVAGKVYAPGYADPAPVNLTSAVLDMQNAYTDGAGRAAGTTELGAGNIGGLTLAPGIYKWGTGVSIPTDVTLSGGANDVWIFQIAGNLTESSAAHVILAGGAQANNVFWVVAGQTTLGTTAVFNGNILDQTAVVLNTGAQLNGRALAQTAVTLDSNAVTKPTSATLMTTPSPAPMPMQIPTPNLPPMQTPSTGGGQTTQTPATSADARVAMQAELNGLLATLHSLQGQAGQPGSAAGQQVRAIAVDLKKGSNDNNVKVLQEFLISQNKGPSAQALTSAGATAHFGALTRAALAEFQANVGISPALGNFGAITRAYISTHY